MLEYLISLIVIVWIFYVYGTWNYGRFKGSKVPYHDPIVLVGNTLRFLLKQENVIENTSKLYKDFSENR